MMPAEHIGELTARCDACATAAVRDLALAADWSDALPQRLDALRASRVRLCRLFPSDGGEVALWENLWLTIEASFERWRRVMRAAARRDPAAERLTRRVFQAESRRLYHWARWLIASHAPRVPDRQHFVLGLERFSADFRELHDRIEGLYESVKRQGRFPVIRHDVEAPRGGVNVGIIYGGGWNVSAYSILQAAAAYDDLHVLVAFDHPGGALFHRAGPHTLRRAPAGLLLDDAGRYVLATFRPPRPLHFVCPHHWSGPAPHEIGVPVLRSVRTLDIVTDKHRASQALRCYGEKVGACFPRIEEEHLPAFDLPVDREALYAAAQGALDRLVRRCGAREVVVKPVRGEQSRGVKDFRVPAQSADAVEHAAELALDSGALLQEKIRPKGGLEYNWRVFVAARHAADPEVVGRFARIGRGRTVEMVAEQDMLRRAGIGPRAGRLLLKRLNDASLLAFRAVCQASEGVRRDVPATPLGGVGSYAVPYILGIDLIGDALVMEINGSEVAGMWTDDRLYPGSRGRTSRTVLESAREAALAYRDTVGVCNPPLSGL